MKVPTAPLPLRSVVVVIMTATTSVRVVSSMPPPFGSAGISDKDDPPTGAALYEKLAGYQPMNQVTDEAAIDLDQEVMSKEMDDHLDLTRALNVYEKGGHSMSIAELLLQEPKGEHIFHAGEKVIGLTEDEEEAVGYLMYPVTINDQPGQQIGLQVQYETHDNQKDYVNCQVGGLHSPNYKGCFAEKGNLSIFHNGIWNTFPYKYDRHKENINGRTLQKFSINAEDDFRTCPVMCPYYDDFQLFVNYYGNTDYADHWVQAALRLRPTDFETGLGDADFSLLAYKPSQAQSVELATAYMAVYMYVIKELEEAIYDCEQCKTNNGECADDPVYDLDAAVAYYVGSLEGHDGSGNGNLMFDLADFMAQHSKTAGEQSSETHGQSYVNHEIMKYFTRMQERLTSQACEDARKLKVTIVNLMKVPLIQGTLRYAFLRSHHYHSNSNAEAKEFEEARGATFTASILPYLYACNEDDADFVHSKMKIGSAADNINYKEFKKTMEKHYDCLGVTCSQIGGFWDPEKEQWEEDASPCKGGGSSGGSGYDHTTTTGSGYDGEDDGRRFNVGLLIFVSMLGAVGAIGIAMFYDKRYKQRRANNSKRYQPIQPQVHNMAAVAAASNHHDASPMDSNGGRNVPEIA